MLRRFAPMLMVFACFILDTTILPIVYGGVYTVPLTVVAVFLISNTITVAAAFRKTENRIMRLIGATNGMIRAPFVIEGTVIGLVGALLPLAAVSLLYRRVAVYLMERFNMLSDIFRFLPLEELFPSMAAVSLGLGIGIGFFVSFFTIRKQLKV